MTAGCKWNWKHIGSGEYGNEWFCFYGFQSNLCGARHAVPLPMTTIYTLLSGTYSVHLCPYPSTSSTSKAIRIETGKSNCPSPQSWTSNVINEPQSTISLVHETTTQPSILQCYPHLIINEQIVVQEVQDSLCSAASTQDYHATCDASTIGHHTAMTMSTGDPWK